MSDVSRPRDLPLEDSEEPLDNSAPFFPSYVPPLPRSSRAILRRGLNSTATRGLLVEIFRSSGLSLNKLAKTLGVSRQSLQQYLRGARVKPSALWLVQFALACGGAVQVQLKDGRVLELFPKADPLAFTEDD